MGEGEVIALVGQSGSGKTTVARMVLGLEEPTAGEIHLEGRRWDGLPESRRGPHRIRYQYVPQDAMSALDPQQNAIEHVVETLSEAAGVQLASMRLQHEAMDLELRKVGSEASGHANSLAAMGVAIGSIQDDGQRVQDAVRTLHEETMRSLCPCISGKCP